MKQTDNEIRGAASRARERMAAGPLHLTTVTTAVLQYLALEYPTLIRGGMLVHMKHRRIAPGVYDVWAPDAHGACPYCGSKAAP